jgi:acetylornithine/succinyldiaminopimelate/putrescine aminotransferase
VAALAVLDLVEAPGFLDRVRALGERLADAFAELPFELRRRGLMMGLAFLDEEDAMAAAKALFEAGVFVVWANNDRSVLQFLPPLILTDAEADELIDRVVGAVG